MSGWEKVSNPAERAIAVMQANSNVSFKERFVSRFGEQTMHELVYFEIAYLLPKVEVLVLERPFRVRDQWKLCYAKEHGEDGLRRELERRRSMRRRSARVEGSA